MLFSRRDLKHLDTAREWSISLSVIEIHLLCGCFEWSFLGDSSSYALLSEIS